jgi:hypothetical protein
MMMRKLPTIVVLGVLLLTSISPAGEAVRNIPIEKTEQFLNLVEKGEIEKGYDQLFEHSAVVQDKAQAFEAVKKQTVMGMAMYGKSLGHEYVSQKNYGNSVVHIVYLMKTKKVPLTWIFDYYRESSEWVIVRVTFNDELKGLGN